MTTPPYPPQPALPPRKRNNTALWVLLAVVGGIFLLCGGCFTACVSGVNEASSKHATTSRTPAPKAVSVPTTMAPPAATLSKDEIADLSFIAALRKEGVRFSSESAVITLGHTVCDGRRAGGTPEAVAMAVVSSGYYSLSDAGYIVGAAQGAYCPEFR
ncbi:DUF732 domain-containing protein [Nocardia wallacei]|uniref:DUF732 domain-containing protein n=1 Tax=Nocardia wallacei TaxID=480035 RepID=UPI0024538694|nr:DUF732 domain-containing protein [Nocardia wallacei]